MSRGDDDLHVLMNEARPHKLYDRDVETSGQFQRPAAPRTGVRDLGGAIPVTPMAGFPSTESLSILGDYHKHGAVCAIEVAM